MRVMIELLCIFGGRLRAFIEELHGVLQLHTAGKGPVPHVADGSKMSEQEEHESARIN